MGPDNLPACVIKNCLSSLISPLFTLFNRSLHKGYFTKQWKLLYIKPIYKNGDKQNIKNYGPISIIGTILKILDAIVANKLADVCLSKIAAQHHGFVKDRLTVTNLLNLVNYIQEQIDLGS